MNLRSAAAQRAHLHHAELYDDEDSIPIPSHHHQQQQQYPHPIHSSDTVHSVVPDPQGWMPPSSMPGSGQPYSSSLAPASSLAAPLPPSPLVASEILHNSRQQWKQHGTGVTQVVEDVRRQGGTWIVRVTDTVCQKDAAGKSYDAFGVLVQHRQQPENNRFHQYRRYSEFHRLHTFLQQHGVQVEATFPPKHWAGRWGLVTPSKTLAPEKHAQLLQYRQQQLDIWLVHVAALFQGNSSTPLPATVQERIGQFLFQPEPLPCERDNQAVGNQAHHQTTPSSYAQGWNNPFSFTLGSALRQATRTLQSMTHPDAASSTAERNIPIDLLQHARGILVLTVLKAGLVVSGRVGSGLILQRNANQWSAPVAIGTVGLGWGAVVGGDITNYLVIFTTDQAVQDILHKESSVQLGGELDVAVGPLGRGAKGQVQTGDWTLHTAYSYAHSQGLFVGVSLEGSVLSVRQDVNRNFYGRALSATEIVQLPPPKAAAPLYQVLEQAMQQEVSEDSFRPSQFLTP